MQADARVVLVDLENMVGAVRPRPALVRACVAVLRAAAGPAHHALACYSTADPATDGLVSVLAELGVAPWPVPPGPDAAETALLAHADYVYRQGGRTFCVASADRRFAALAELGRLEVLAWERQPIARRLIEAADVLRQLPRPDTAIAGVPRIARPDELAKSPAAALDAAAAARQRRPLDLAQSALVGVCTGFGMAAGQRLISHLLSRGRR